jgi:hypothetical protein
MVHSCLVHFNPPFFCACHFSLLSRGAWSCVLIGTDPSVFSQKPVLAWSKIAITGPLTEGCDENVRLRKLSIKTNRTLLGYCGDLIEVDLKQEFGGDVRCYIWNGRFVYLACSTMGGGYS